VGASDGSFWQRVRAWFGSSQPVSDPIVRALVPQQRCPVCTNAAEVEEHLCATVHSAMKQSDDFLTHYRSSSGLCVRHFSVLIAHSNQSQQRTALINAQLAIWQSLEGELSEFIRKNNHRFRDEKFGDERDSWERAIALTSGPQPASTSSRGGLTQTG
ncbi:MAG: DUF6062 family protein, partial [Caldilinea sp.]